MFKVQDKLCVGCKVCELVCSLHYRGDFNPKKAKLRIVPPDDQGRRVLICRQCKKPKCVSACPTGALSINENSSPEVVVEHSLCNRCGACIEACPFDAIFLDPEETVIYKCDLCRGEPLCAVFCSQKAILIESDRV